MSNDTLWMGGEDISFPVGGGTMGISQVAGQFDSDFARCAIGEAEASNIKFLSNDFRAGAVTDAWLHYQVFSGSSPQSTRLLMGLCDSGESHATGLWLQLMDTRYLRIVTFDGSTVSVLATSASTIPYEAVTQCDLQVSGFGVSATVNVYLNGSSTAFLTFTGDVTVGGMTDMNCVGLQAKYDGNANNTVVVSEIVVANFDTRSSRIKAHIPNGAGDAMDFTGSADGSEIDESTINDSDIIYSDTDGHDAQFAMSDSPTGTFAVLAAKVEARAIKTAGAAVGTLKMGIKESGGAVDLDAGQTPDAIFDTVERYMTSLNSAALTTTKMTQGQLALRVNT